MGQEYTAKSFKSGNSVAIRIPAGLGVEADREWLIVRDDNGDLVIRARPVEPQRIDLTGIYGSRPGLKPLRSEDRAISASDLDWAGQRATRD